MSVIGKAKQRIRGLLGIVYDKTETELMPIIPQTSLGDRGIGSGGVKESIGRLLSLLGPHVKNKNSIYKTYSGLKTIHIVESILDKVGIDLMQKGRVQGAPFIEVEYAPDKKIQDILQTTVESFHIERNINEVIFDFLLYGEYFFKVDYKCSELDDRYNYNDALVVYTRGVPSKCIPINTKKDLMALNGVRSKEQLLDKGTGVENYFILSLPGTRIKLEMQDRSGTQFYVKIPKPFISPYTIELINMLLLLEKLIPLSQLIKLDKGQLLTCPVPPGTPVGQIFNICKEYENWLNSNNNLDITSTDVNDLMKHFGKYKVIPTLGEKGSSEVRDLPSPQELTFENFEYIIKALTSRLNIPTNYIINGMEEDSPKSILLYFNRLKQIREGMAESIKHFLLHYMTYRQTKMESKIFINPKELKVILPPIPGTESLDSIDYQDSLSGTLSNIHRILEDYSRLLMEPNKAINKEALVTLLNAKVSPLLGGDMFKYEPELDEEPDEDEGGY